MNLCIRVEAGVWEARWGSSLETSRDGRWRRFKSVDSEWDRERGMCFHRFFKSDVARQERGRDAADATGGRTEVA